MRSLARVSAKVAVTESTHRVSRRWSVLLALVLGVVIGTIVSAVWTSYWVPFEPNVARFNSAASRAVAAAQGSREWVEVGLPWDLAWLAKGQPAVVFVNRGHRFVFFPQGHGGFDSIGGYFYSTDGASPSAMLEEGGGAPRLAPHWWSGRLSRRFLAGR
jgi:hypothetical protein